MTLGAKLKELRLQKGLSQAKVASEAKISRRSYISYEQNMITPKRTETYEHLAEALGCDVKELLFFKDSATSSALGGAAAALSILGFALGPAALPLKPLITGGSIAALAAASASRSSFTLVEKNSSDDEEAKSVEYNNDLLLDYEKKQRQFQAIAIGVIYSKLASKSISFQPGNKDDLDCLGGLPDEYLKIHGENESEWWLSFWAKDDKLDNSAIITENDRAAVMISRFTTSKYDENRKITIVVDDESLYNAVLNYKGHNSFNGNMSVMQIDTESISILKEEYIASI